MCLVSIEVRQQKWVRLNLKIGNILLPDKRPISNINISNYSYTKYECTHIIRNGKTMFLWAFGFRDMLCYVLYMVLAL